MTPYYEHGGITIYHGDARDVLASVSADVLVTDPPYGVSGLRRAEASLDRARSWEPQPAPDAEVHRVRSLFGEIILQSYRFPA